MAESARVRERLLARARSRHSLLVNSDSSLATVTTKNNILLTSLTQSRSQPKIVRARLKLQEQQINSQSLVYSNKLNLLKTQEELKNLETEITTLVSEITQSQTQIESLKFQLTQRTVKAPIEGIIFQFD